ncbi:uncharacterized protein MELLADRAFT_91968 [Melampsora larici-populina 98AG31]|uniref:TNase-like domain-containing protein n=1 Tax=Melampsora larici-populina (strain 98AG31 / pathotype 3-4-7) TaxID=747676 RepID=F4S121_MELLP|nr:uncharacterized protein MELLADRAFT_91968 [Melampsora larici-populina 98AG31]EGG01715.1 hypothetical protein MELLADRAFT_91968 [Melampsora larici-populina 98AG31]
MAVEVEEADVKVQRPGSRFTNKPQSMPFWLIPYEYAPSSSRVSNDSQHLISISTEQKGLGAKATEGYDGQSWSQWIRQKLQLGNSNKSRQADRSESLSLSQKLSDSSGIFNQHRTTFAFISGSIFTGLFIWTTKYGYKTFFRRISNSDYVTPRLLGRSTGSRGKGLTIKGFVTSVGDADNFRLYHTPGFGWSTFRSIPKQKPALKDQTIHIRLAGVDAPELSHFGHPEQPFSQEALLQLKKLVDQKTVKVQMLSKDRYNRIVGMVYVRRWWCSPLRRKNVSLAMVEAGLATVYRSSGAEHGSILNQLTAAEAKARKNKLGMWSQSAKDFESPKDYKLRFSKDSGSS